MDFPGKLHAERVISLPISALVPDPRNARTHDETNAAAVRESLERFGQTTPILVRRGTNVVLAGNLRLAVARSLGWTHLAVVELDLTDEEALALAIADNRTAELAAWDETVLAGVLSELAPELVIGWTEDELAALGVVDPVEPEVVTEDDETAPEERETRKLEDEFIVPPFTLLDGRSGTWQTRKGEWVSFFQRRGLDPSEGRPENLLAMGEGTLIRLRGSTAELGTSIFDPVLCELAYAWFCPEGGRVFDPFAGGPMRGIVAGRMGLDYLGTDIREEQIAVNRRHATAIFGSEETEVFEANGYLVASDAGVAGGTKTRALDAFMRDRPEEEFVYASPAEGFAQIALAVAARRLGRRATIFVGARKELHPRTARARALGARVEQVSGTRLVVAAARAREYAKESGACLVPFGLDCEEIISLIASHARSVVHGEPPEVWCAAGSGTLSRALQAAFPRSKHVAVRVGRVPDAGAARVVESPRSFGDDAPRPPFASCRSYDAKAWEEMLRANAPTGSLLWNVAGDDVPAHPRWSATDARFTEIPPCDFVFSCPPYGDLETYSDDPRDISTMDRAAFLEAYRGIVAASAAALRPHRFAIFVVGNYREKGVGFLHDLCGDTVRAFEDAGLRFYCEGSLATMIGSASMRARKIFNSRKLTRIHQNVLVFAKGDPRKAASAVKGHVAAHVARAGGDRVREWLG